MGQSEPSTSFLMTQNGINASYTRESSDCPKELQQAEEMG